MDNQGLTKDTMEKEAFSKEKLETEALVMEKRYEEEKNYYLKEWDDEDIEEGFKFALEINGHIMQIEEQKGKLEPDEMEKFREKLIKEQIEFVHNGLKARNDIKKMKKSLEDLVIDGGEK